MSEKQYEPITEVRKKLQIPWYRCPIEREKLKELTRRSDLKGFVQTVGHLAPAASTGTATYFFFLRGLWVPFALGLFVHGTVYSFIRAGRHELSHCTVFKTMWLNVLFVHIAGGYESVALVPTMKYAFKLAFARRFDDRSSEDIFTLVQAKERAKAVNLARITLLFHASLITLSIVFGLYLLPVLVTFSAFIGNWGRYFVGMPMHNGLRDNVADFRKCVRTINLDPLVRFLYWRMNYHAEHHMFAAVPCYNLRGLQKAIAFGMPAPRGLIQAWREMRETWKKQQEDPSHQFDTPVPSHDDSRADGQDDLDRTLGELKL